MVETTAKVKAEERLKTEGERLRQMFEQAPGFVATLVGPDHVFENANNAYLQLVDHRDIVGKPVGEALPEVVEQRFLDLLDRVFSTRRPYVGNGMRVLLKRQHDMAPDERYLDFIFQPVFDDAGRVTGIFVRAMTSPSRRWRRMRCARARRAFGLRQTTRPSCSGWATRTASASI